MGQQETAETGVPAWRKCATPWLRRIVQRGLAKDPEQRWPSMDVLLATLARGRTRARQRWGVAAAGVVVATAAGVVGWQYEREQRRIRACEAEGAAIIELAKVEISMSDRKYKDAILRCRDAARQFSWVPSGERIRKRLGELESRPEVKKAMQTDD